MEQRDETAKLLPPQRPHGDADDSVDVRIDVQAVRVANSAIQRVRGSAAVVVVRLEELMRETFINLMRCSPPAP
eukprot:jgi/Chlat1/3973/Chrsp26S04215